MAEVSRQYEDRVILDYLEQHRGLDLGRGASTRVEVSQLNPFPNDDFTVDVRVTYKLSAREADEMLQAALILPD